MAGPRRACSSAKPNTKRVTWPGGQLVRIGTTCAEAAVGTSESASASAAAELEVRGRVGHCSIDVEEA